MCSLSSHHSRRVLLGMGSAPASCLVPLLFASPSFPVTLGKVVFFYLALEYSSQDMANKLSSQPCAFFLETAPHRTWAINCEQANEIVIPFLASWEDAAVSKME